MNQTLTPEASHNESGSIGALIGRYGRGSLVILGIIVLLGFGARMDRVVNPLATPGDDALAYRALAQSLYEDGSYGGPGFNTPSDWSPGAPLIYSAAYYLTGGVRDGVARGVEALFGTASILLAYLLAFRLSRRRAAPLLAAAFVAFYPPFIHSIGALMSEPPAMFTLPAAVLAFWWADGKNRWWAWILPGLLLGATALIRPEYLLVALLFGVFLLVRSGMKAGARPTIIACLAFGLAVLLPVVPWTIRNHNELGRWVPISTGSGKALYVGTYLPADGDYQRVKADLLERYRGRSLPPGSAALDKVNPVPLFNQPAKRYHPPLTRDEALGKIGKENFRRYLKAQPLDYLGMTVRKVGRMWGSGVGEAISSPLGATIQKLLVLAGLAGLLLIAWRRRWESITMAIPIAAVTAVGAVTLAPSRRSEILMTLVLPLAAVALAEAVGWLRAHIMEEGT